MSVPIGGRDEVQDVLKDALTYHAPFTDKLKRSKDPSQLGSFPFSFYDRHLEEDSRLKKVVLLPSILADLSRQVDDHMESFQHRSIGPWPLNDETRSRWDFDGTDSAVDSMPNTAWNLARLYAQIERGLTSLPSQWLITPNYRKYASTLAFNTRRKWFQRSFNDPVVDYSLRFRDYLSHPPQLLDELDDLSKNMLRDLQEKELATWVYLPPFAQVEAALKEMDKVASLSTFPASFCTTGGIPKPESPPSDSQPPIDGMSPPWILPRIIAKARIPSKSPGLKSIRPDSRTNQRLPDFARSEKPTPEGILHNAWKRAVEVDSTILVINCGAYERIGIRHRATQTLYLSNLIEVWKNDPPYGKLHLGLQMAVIHDVIDRYKQRASRDTTHAKKPERKRRQEITKEAPPAKRRSPRIAYTAMQADVARTQGKNGQAKEGIWKAIDRPCALVNLRYPPFNSPAPATCLRIGQPLSPQVIDTTSHTWKTKFDHAECFNITLNSIFADGTAGFIHSGTLEVVVGGELLRHEVLIKVTTHPDTRKRLHREFSMYKKLWSHKIEGIPAIYGLFEDYDNLATLLVMERAGVSLRHRQPKHVIDDSIFGISPREIADCVLIVEQIHKAGVLHRDLRVDNIVFTPEGKPKIIDFDRARFSTSEEDQKHEIDTLKSYLSGDTEFCEWSGSRSASDED